MLESQARFRCCEAYLRGVAKTVNLHSASTPSYRTPVRAAKRVLIVEHRDEVFADLRSLFEARRCQVAQIVSGAVVADQIKQFVPDLLLVNETMPDESGWLISCKLQFTKNRPTVWLYAERARRMLEDWMDVCGIDEVLEYGGIRTRLDSRVRERLRHWLHAFDADRQQGQTSRNSAQLVAKCA